VRTGLVTLIRFEMDAYQSRLPLLACAMSTGVPSAAAATAALAAARAAKSRAVSTKLANYPHADEKLHSLSRKAVAVRTKRGPPTLPCLSLMPLDLSLSLSLADT
jgi:uncharacterized protein (DUF1501 family)